MRFLDRRTARLLAPVLALTLVAAACGGDDDGDDGGTGTGGGGGDVVVTGSSTVEPISIAVAEAFADESDVNVSVDGPGTGDGFALFCEGGADVTGASRPIKDEEAGACEAAGVEFVELKVAFDGIAVLTSPENDAVECLTFADLYALAGPESQGVGSWSDASELAAELGSSTELPDVDLTMVAPGEESGTYDSFIELVFKDIAEARVEAGAIGEEEAESSRPDYQASGDDNVIIQGIQGAEGSFGWVGFAFAHEAGDGVKTLEVDGGEGCVAPTPETIADGSYPVSRPLFIYVNAANAAENESVSAYVDFYLNDGISAVEEVGYVALPDDQLAESRSTWDVR